MIGLYHTLQVDAKWTLSFAEIRTYPALDADFFFNISEIIIPASPKKTI
jgi:hypothetical protein